LTGCLAGEFSAMVTAPVQKSVINDAGMAFSGHTEFLAERTGATVVMMLVGATASGPLRVALATTHMPLSAVPAAITHELLTRTVRIVADELTAKFRIAKPRIAVCGLNPHAGEGGYLGREEIEIITPALTAPVRVARIQDRCSRRWSSPSSSPRRAHDPPMTPM
jgi:4-hydroxythreonine-4-phosphate dehydrogenase